MKRFERILPVLVCPEGLQGLELRAVDIFAQGIRLRTGIELLRSPIPMPGRSNAVILSEARFLQACSRQDRALARLDAPGAEGFRLFFDRPYENVSQRRHR